MTDIATLGFNVDTRGLKKGEKALDKYSRTGDKVERNTERNAKGMSMSYGMLASAIGVVASSLVALGKLTSVSREFDVLNAQLITATGSAESAANAFEALQQFASTTPYDLQQATKAFTQLVNLGLTPSEEALKSYGNTASAMGKDLSQMVEAVADATTGEFERLKEFGIKAKSEGDNVSLTFRGVTKTIGKNAAEIEGYLLSLGQNEFAGAMAERAKTLDGAISNLGDTWDGLFLTISKQGVGNLIQDGVMIAADSIQMLTDMIDSGALSESVGAIGSKFDGFVGDVANGFHLISAIVGDSADGWGDSVELFFDNMLGGFKQLPEMTRFFIQMAAVNIGKFVDYAKIYGDAFVDVMGLRFDKLVARAELDGRKIANAMNPFSDTLDYGAELAKLEKQFADAENNILANAQSRADTASNIATELINGYALESVAIEDNYKARIGLSQQLLKAYQDEKKAKSGDRLKQYKVVAGEADKATTAISKQATEYQKWLKTIENSTGQLERLEKEMQAVWHAMDTDRIDVKAGFEYLDQLQERVDDLKSTLSGSDMFGMVGDSAKESLGAVQKLSEQGSNSYKALGLAVQSVTVAQNVMKSVTETSLATITGGVTAVLGLVGMIGSLGSGIKDESAGNQAKQGLSVWGDKADAIEKSIIATSSATEQLVGINTGMLNALKSMQAGISSASGMSARGASNADFGFTSNVGKSLFGSETLNKLVGGSSKVVDSGIEILGGAMSDVIDGASVFAFEKTKSKKYAWSSSKSNTEFQALDDASKQFSLVFQSLADTVFAGGEALGLGTDEMTKAINDFEIATTRISLKGLSIEEQQAEIEAVFSTIFSDLTGSIVPFIGEFQQAGEELGETLSRVASEVMVTEELTSALGVSLGDKLANPQLFAEISTNLSELTGGLELFASKSATFIDAFAPENVKFDMVSDAFNSAMNDAGLGAITTAEQYWEAMQTGSVEQIATLLNTQDVAKEYFDLLEDRSDEALANQLEQQALLDKAEQEAFDKSVALMTAKGDLELKLLQTQGKEAEALAVIRRREMEATDESLQSLLGLIHAQEDANKLQAEADAQLQKDLDAQKAIDDARMSALEKQRNELDAFNKSINGVSESLTSAIDNMYGATRASNVIALDAALISARGGDFSKALNLNTGGLSADTSSFGSSAAFAIEQAETAQKMKELADLTGVQLSTDEMILTTQQEQTELLMSINKGIEGGAPAQTEQSEQYRAVVIELQAIRADISSAKDAAEATAKNTLNTSDDLDAIRRDGLDVRIEA